MEENLVYMMGRGEHWKFVISIVGCELLHTEYAQRPDDFVRGD